MAHSLETRVPFLDNELVDFALRLPVALQAPRALPRRVRVDENVPGKRQLYEAERNDGKVVLREGDERVLPPDGDRRATKQGFSAPDASWFRGESIEYINRLLGDPKARIYEFLDPAYVQAHRRRAHLRQGQPPAADLVAAQLRVVVPVIPGSLPGAHARRALCRRLTTASPELRRPSTSGSSRCSGVRRAAAS